MFATSPLKPVLSELLLIMGVPKYLALRLLNKLFVADVTACHANSYDRFFSHITCSIILLLRLLSQFPWATFNKTSIVSFILFLFEWTSFTTVLSWCHFIKKMVTLVYIENFFARTYSMFPELLVFPVFAALWPPESVVQICITTLFMRLEHVQIPSFHCMLVASPIEKGMFEDAGLTLCLP